MSEIKVEFYRTENFVYGRVLEMPEELRGKVRISDGIYGIFSDEGPSLDGRCLFLKGKHKYCDDEWFACTYCDSDTAERTIQSFQSLIEEWNEKHKEILTKKEKKYLSAVIKPFKKRINFIAKYGGWRDNEELISINYDGGLIMTLPKFKQDSMYKGMAENKNYTLKELGLE